jgi:predicted RNA-binding protein associated with RNAse of E/G family
VIVEGTDVVEVKRNLDGAVIEFACKAVILEQTRAVITMELERPVKLRGRLVELPARTQTYGYFWLDKPYVVYHWRHESKTVACYINIGRLQAIGDGRVVWDDYAVDVVVLPDGRVAVLDEDEVPETIAPELRRTIADATQLVLSNAAAITAAVERETRSLEAARRAP